MPDLAVKVYGKHVDNGDSSQLKALEDEPSMTTGPTIGPARVKHNEPENLKDQMEADYRKRDLLIPRNDEALKDIRYLLEALDSKNPKRLAE